MSIVLIIVINIFVHELFHYLALRVCGQKGEVIIEFLPPRFGIEINEEIKHPRLFFISGTLGNLFVAVVCWICGADQYFLYSVMVVLFNLIVIAPDADIFKVLGLEKLRIKELPEMIWNASYIVVAIAFLVFIICWIW